MQITPNTAYEEMFFIKADLHWTLQCKKQDFAPIWSMNVNIHSVSSTGHTYSRNQVSMKRKKNFFLAINAWSMNIPCN